MLQEGIFLFQTSRKQISSVIHSVEVEEMGEYKDGGKARRSLYI